MKSLFKILISFIIGLAIATGYWISHYSPNINMGKKLINNLLNSNPKSAGKYEITKTFTVNSSLIGYVIARKATPFIPETLLFSDANGQYIINGLAAINQNRQSLYNYGYMRYISSSANKQIIQKIQKTHYITQGKNSAPHKLWVGIDPNCIWCHETFVALQPAIKSGQVQVRWVVLGFLKPSSKAKAMAILSSLAPLAALKENEAKFNIKTEEGGIKPLLHPSQKVKDLFNQNMAIVKSDLVIMTPIFVFNMNKTNHVKTGYPGSDAKTIALAMAAGKTFA